MKVTKARKSSLGASVRVTKKRTNEIEHFRSQTAGKTTAASEAQQIHELKKLTIGKRECICQASGVKKRVVINRKTGLHLKTLFGVSWNKHSQQKRILASYGVKFESERKERNLREELVQEQIVVKNMEVTVSDDTKSSDTSTATRSVAHIHDNPSFVKNTL